MHREPITEEFAGYGYQPARVFATAAEATEIAAGALTLVGLATPVAGALIVATCRKPSLGQPGTAR